MYKANHDLINNAVEYIEQNVKMPITLDDLSKALHISKFHMLRLFKSLTGKTLMEYIRGRKLTVSLSDLLNTNMNIIDIALNYNFQYEQTYDRAFKNLFKVSPAAYRKNPGEIPVVPIYDINFIHDVEQGIIAEPYFTMKPEFYVTGIKSEIVHADNDANLTGNKLAIDFYFNHLDMIDDKIDETVYFGLTKYSDNPEYSNDYITCVEVKSKQEVSPPFCCERIPTNIYAVFKYIGFHPPEELSIDTLRGVYRYVFNEWIPNTKYVLESGYHFERVNLKICAYDYCEADLYMPIQENNT